MNTGLCERIFDLAKEALDARDDPAEPPIELSQADVAWACEQVPLPPSSSPSPSGAAPGGGGDAQALRSEVDRLQDEVEQLRRENARLRHGPRPAFFALPLVNEQSLVANDYFCSCIRSHCLISIIHYLLRIMYTPFLIH